MTTGAAPGTTTAGGLPRPQPDPPDPAAPAGRACRLCGAAVGTTFVDLGMSPPCESYLTAEQLDQPEVTYPLHVRVCDRCLLVQLPPHVPAADIFSDYAYFSSYSTTWVDHARSYAESVIPRLALGRDSFVVEVASNDGYLLQHFVRRGVPVLGIDPAANVAAVARARGVPTEVRFLGEAVGRDVAARHRPADLVVANNVLAHVPDLLDFVRGLRALVAPTGVVTLEFPHLQRLVEGRQYDTIYHEHYSYFTLLTAARALAAGGLAVVDVEEIATHGGSLRVWTQPGETAGPPTEAVGRVLAAEGEAGLHEPAGYRSFGEAVLTVKRDLLDFLLTASREGRTVVGYGAPGKGNTLLNHCGVRADLLPFTVDRNPLKQGRFLPGTHIPVLPPERLDAARPDYVLVLPWNLRAEILAQLSHVRDWGGRFAVPIPALVVC